MILAIIQARMGSTRLPGKVLLDLEGKPVLWHVVNRVLRSKIIDKVIVATSNKKIDKPIIEFCYKNNIDCFCGSENDVLDRYYQAAKKYFANEEDNIVRITADCPVIDPQIIDKVIALFINSKADYATNTKPPSFPDGLDVEVVTFKALEKAWKEAKYHSEREHVTPFIHKHPTIFKQVNLKNEEDLSRFRWTLDEPEDYKLIKIIYKGLYEKNKLFLMEDILKLFEEEMKLLQINMKYRRDEGYEKSLKNDFVISMEERNENE